jgi:hypothetical protein
LERERQENIRQELARQEVRRIIEEEERAKPRDAHGKKRKGPISHLLTQEELKGLEKSGLTTNEIRVVKKRYSSLNNTMLKDFINKYRQDTLNQNTRFTTLHSLKQELLESGYKVDFIHEITSYQSYVNKVIQRSPSEKPDLLKIITEVRKK